MKQCSRRNKKTLEKCGMPFEGSGSYCKTCRNEYQKEYYAMRKYHPQRSSTTVLNLNCQLCGVGLRSNSLERIELDNSNWETMTLCGPCKAAVVYAGRTVDEETTEAIVEAILKLSRFTHTEREEQSRPFVPGDNVPITQRPLTPKVVTEEEKARRAAQREAELEEYYDNLAKEKKAKALAEATKAAVILEPGNFVACGACDNETRPGKKFCTEHADEE